MASENIKSTSFLSVTGGASVAVTVNGGALDSRCRSAFGAGRRRRNREHGLEWPDVYQNPERLLLQPINYLGSDDCQMRTISQFNPVRPNR